jgi:hypothetical protein
VKLAIKVERCRSDPGGSPIPRHPEATEITRTYKATTLRDPGSLDCPGFFFVAGPFEGVAHASQALHPLAFPQRLSEDRPGRGAPNGRSQ